VWSDAVLRLPVLKQWREYRQREFLVGDIVLEAPNPVVSRSVRKSLRKNDYERAEAYLVRRLVRPGDAVLDLGSGLGLTCIIAARASRGGRIVGYEANPVIAPLAEKNVRRNGVQAEIRNRGIGRWKGACEFHLRRSFTASSAIPSKRSKAIHIQTDAFQDVVNEIQPAVIVCDIEGIEGNLFVSVNLQSVRRLILEVHPQLIGEAGVAECVQDLEASGLSPVQPLSFGHVLVFDRDGSALTIEPYSPDRSPMGA
jgi:FkbM family methyltransferase